MILAAVPRHIQAPDPLTKDLRLDIHNEVKEPKILSNFEQHITQNGLKDDLESYFKHKKPSLIQDICTKIHDSREQLGPHSVPNQSVVNAVVLFITQQQLKDRR